VDEYCEVCTSGLVANGDGATIPYALETLCQNNYNMMVRCVARQWPLSVRVQAAHTSNMHANRKGCCGSLYIHSNVIVDWLLSTAVRLLQLALERMMDTRRLKNDEWKSAVWDDDERRAFEEGFAAHGKQFHMVSRTVCGWMDGTWPARKR
jgi:hypothetical protein